MISYLDFQDHVDWAVDTFITKTDYDWLIHIVLIVLGTALVSFVLALVMNRFGKTLNKPKTKWYDLAIVAAKLPVKVLVWVVGLSFALDVVKQTFTDAPLKHLSLARELAIVIILTWAANRFIEAGERYVVRSRQRKGKPVDPTSVDAISKLLKIVTNIIAGLLVLETLGVSVGGLLAFGGLGGLVAGLAAKDLLANFFGAFLIYYDKPFKVGEWINIPERNLEGTVEAIGWRMTTIMTFDKRPTYMPNSLFTSLIVENPDRMTHRRIMQHIGVRHQDRDKLPQICAAIRDLLSRHPEIDPKETYMAHVDRFSESSCDVLVYAYTYATDLVDFKRVQHDVMMKIADIIEAQGAELAHPTREVRVTTATAPGEVLPGVKSILGGD